ncbi:unnamed protein product, partial [Meganyctiphanes norvegica]
SLVLLLITILVFLTHNAFHWFKDFSPVEYKETGNLNGEVDDGELGSSGAEVITTYEVATQFVPAVLRDAPTGVEQSYEYVSQHRKYGTQPDDSEEPEASC